MCLCHPLAPATGRTRMPRAAAHGCARRARSGRAERARTGRRPRDERPRLSAGSSGRDRAARRLGGAVRRQGHGRATAGRDWCGASADSRHARSPRVTRHAALGRVAPLR